MFNNSTIEVITFLLIPCPTWTSFETLLDPFMLSFWVSLNLSVVNIIGAELFPANGAAANASTNLSFPPTYPSLAINNSDISSFL